VRSEPPNILPQFWSSLCQYTECGQTGQVRHQSDCEHFRTGMTHLCQPMIFLFFTNLLHKLFILILFYIPLHVSSTIVLRFRRTNCISAASGIVTVFWWLFSAQVTRGLQSCRNMCTEQSPKESDDTSLTHRPSLPPRKCSWYSFPL